MEKMYQYKYPHPAITTDAVVFGYDGKQLHLLLIERGIEPYKGSWALPGGFMNIDETVEQCAMRELREETGVENVYLEQFHVFSSVRRDPRERVVTVAFFALVRKSDYKLIAADDAARASWFVVDELPPLAFDHDEIIRMGREHLKEVLRVRPIAFKLLDKKFSMPELQRLYEIINETTYDRRNFARKMISTNLISHSDSLHKLNDNVCYEAAMPSPQEISFSRAPHRVANLYSFDEETYEEQEKKEKKKGKPRNPFNI